MKNNTKKQRKQATTQTKKKKKKKNTDHTNKKISDKHNQETKGTNKNTK